MNTTTQLESPTSATTALDISHTFVMKERFHGMMHARCATAIAGALSDLTSNVTITLLSDQQPSVDARSTLRMMLDLGEAKDGCRLLVRAVGKDAQLAIDRLSALSEVWVSESRDPLRTATLPDRTY